MLDLFESASVRLTKGGHIEDRYATLSHCWGAGAVATTTRATLEAHEAGIPLSSLPLLFQDAIAVARALGLRYLWIDALCIVQDDMDEWKTEAANMAEIFRSSYITLAATSAADSDHSMFPVSDAAMVEMLFEIPVSPIGPQRIVNRFALHPKANPLRDIVRAPLNRRGWVLQELTLSPRTLHYSQHQLYWHCADLAASEDGTFQNESGVMETLGWYYGPNHKLDALEDAIGRNEHQSHPALACEDTSLSVARLWWALVEDYTERSLTYASDRLIAIAGIANQLRVRTNDEYVAGFWRQDLVHSLLWSAPAYEYTIRPIELSNIPSWSWASTNGAVRMPRELRTVRGKPVLEVVTVDTVKSGTLIASQVPVGPLRLRGRLLILRRGPIVNGECALCENREGSQTVHGYGQLDVQPSEAAESAKTVHVLGVTATSRGNDKLDSVELGIPEVNVLLLEEVPSLAHTYRRLGIGTLDCWSNWDVAELNLV